MHSSIFADSGAIARHHLWQAAAPGRSAPRLRAVRQRVAAISGHFLRWIIVNALLK